MAEYNINAVARHFRACRSLSPYGNGHINDTYLFQSEDFIIQRINHQVFRQPEEVMHNIALVTAHLRKKILAEGGDPARETLTLIQTVDGEDFYRDKNGNYFRAYVFIRDADAYERVESPDQLFHAGKAFGTFQRRLSDFPAGRLYETIPNFHNTRSRFAQLQTAIREDVAGRLREAGPEVKFALAREQDVDVIVDGLLDGSLPTRVTHNDTKLNNVLLDRNTGEGVCVIDLDTVMPGSLLYDYGDAIRFGANHGAEDDRNLSNVYCDMALYEAFTRGFIGALGDAVTEQEAALMPFSAKLMTYECGIRFLTDFLNGDIYFKIHYEKQNLDRARAQFRLVQDLEEKEPVLRGIVAALRDACRS